MTNKIAINGRVFSRRISGVERYAHEVSRRIHSSRVIGSRFNHGPLSGNLWEQLILPMQIKQNEVLWSPANAGPWLIQNQVLTLHDASVFDHPEWFKPSFAAWSRLSWKILAGRVKAVITVSNFSSERLKIHLGIPQTKIHVIHNGVGSPFEPQPQNKIDDVKTKYGIGKPYFLFVGTNEPRKNISTLLQAWKKIKSLTHTLFIAGGEGHVFADIQPCISTYVADQDLAALYSGATAYITTSQYEGFGLPALEAMACGTPVVAPKTTSFPEILGDAALLIDPNNLNEISSTLQKLMDEPQLAVKLKERGFQQIKKFTWDNAAKKTQSLLENIA